MEETSDHERYLSTARSITAGLIVLVCVLEALVYGQR